MGATTEKREAVGLTENERTSITKLAGVYSQIHGETNKLIAIAYLEGMAAASTNRPPQATA